jgi:16S rRNA (guanine527-N7)-methyltransferase
MPLSDPRAALLAAAPSLGLALTEPQVETLCAYLALLGKWVKVYNLTAVRDPQQMLSQHVLDCLAIIDPLRRRRGEGFRLLDAGSGGGLPGLVIATLLPRASVTCVDAVGKKAAFIRQAVLELGLRNASAVHSRVEDLVGDPFDVVASRAFASLADFVTLTRPRLRADGVWAAMKGQLLPDELAAVPADVATVFHVEPLRVPMLDADRHLVWMRPAG